MMKIVDLKQLPDQAWQSTILENYRFPPMWWIRQVDTPSRRRLMCRDLSESLNHPDAYLLGAVNDGEELIGFAEMRPLAWDTDHFGFKVLKLGHMGTWGAVTEKTVAVQKLGRAITDLARRCEARTVHARIPLDDIGVIHALEEEDFRLMEVLQMSVFNLNKQDIPENRSGYPSRDFESGDEPAVIELARHAYTTTPDRFHADPHLPPDRADALYADWLKNSCSREAADYIAVVEVEGRVKAYGTLRHWDDQGGLCNIRSGQFLLGAVAPDIRECGLIKTIMIALLHWLEKQNADVAIVGTQANNIGSLNSMASLGFKPVSSTVGMHLWLDS